MRLGWKRKRGFFLKAGRLKPAALDSIDDLLVDQEAGELLDQASRPPRLLHTQARPGCVEVKSVDLPGVRLELGRRRAPGGRPCPAAACGPCPTTRPAAGSKSCPTAPSSPSAPPTSWPGPATAPDPKT